MLAGMTTRTLDELVDHIRAAMEGDSIRSVADRAGISHSALAKLLNKTSVPQPDTLRALARTLGLNESHLLRLAGHLEEGPRQLTDPSVIHLAQQLEALPSDKRAAALDAIRPIIESYSQETQRRVLDLLNVIRFLIELRDNELVNHAIDHSALVLITSVEPEYLEMVIERAMELGTIDVESAEWLRSRYAQYMAARGEQTMTEQPEGDDEVGDKAEQKRRLKASSDKTEAEMNRRMQRDRAEESTSGGHGNGETEAAKN